MSNEIKTLIPKEDFVEVVYGDSVTGDSIIATSEGDITIADLFCMGETLVYGKNDKQYTSPDIKVKDKDGNFNPILYVMRHKTSKEIWKITTTNHSVKCTTDHSLMVCKSYDNLKPMKPTDVCIGDLMWTFNKNEHEEWYAYEKITEIENLDCIDDYVYDISVDGPQSSHVFYANGILVHNTDSCDRNTIIHTDSGDFTIEELFEQSSLNNKKITYKGVELTTPTAKILNWNDGLCYTNVKYISKHHVTKKKWELKTKSGKSVIVTEDHSLIVFRDGKKIEVKPRDVLSTDKILIAI